MQKLLPATVLVLGAGFTLLTFYSPAGTSSLSQPAPTAPQQSSAQSARPSGDSAQVTQVDFQDTQPLTMSSEDATKYHVTMFLKNDELVQSTLQFAVALEDSQRNVLSGGSQVSFTPKSLAQSSVTAVQLTIDSSGFSAPLSGYLQLTANAAPDRKPSIKYRALKVPGASPSAWASTLFWLSLVGTGLVALGSIRSLRKLGIPLKQKMGSPTWSFGDSWGTNIAVGGALLNTLVTFSALPEQTHYLSKVSYVCLSMIFGAVITVAPSLYALIRTGTLVAVPGGNPVIQYQGYVGCFVLASALTAWGAMGQVVTVGCLFLELETAHAISVAMMRTLGTLLTVVGVFLLVYERRTIVQTAQLQKKASEPSATGGAEEAAVQALPSWSLL